MSKNIGLDNIICADMDNGGVKNPQTKYTLTHCSLCDGGVVLGTANHPKILLTGSRGGHLVWGAPQASTKAGMGPQGGPKCAVRVMGEPKY